MFRKGGANRCFREPRTGGMMSHSRFKVEMPRRPRWVTSLSSWARREGPTGPARRRSTRIPTNRASPGNFFSRCRVTARARSRFPSSFDALADRAGVTGRTAFSQAVDTVVCADMGPAHVRIITGHIKCGYRTGLQAGFCKAAVTGRGIKDGLPKLLCHRQSATQRQQQPIPLVNQHVQW